MEIIKAEFESYIYRNAENGYSIISLSNGIKAVGVMPDLSKGVTLELTGEYETHNTYGRQFRIESYSIIEPVSIEGIIKYLGSGIIKGIGLNTAKKIVDIFREKTLDVLENDVEKLLEIEGIGKKKLEQIKNDWNEQKIIKDIMLFFNSHNISSNVAAKIYKLYGKNSIKIVKENPYRLASDVWGIGFKTADQLGKSLGYTTEHPARIKAGILFTLEEAANDGHVFLPIEILYKRCSRILEADITEDYNILTELEDDEAIKISGSNIYRALFFYAELYVEKKIQLLNGMLNNIPEKEIAEIKISEKKYSQEQFDAISNALLHKITIITGGPGTGKTTTLKGIIAAYMQLNKSIMLAAPTGRAAKRMSEVVGLKASTIHRLLEYNPAGLGFNRNEHNPLECDLLIIDEVSMIDILLFNSLLRAVTEKTTLILVGDVDQLPSVGAGNVLNDLIGSDLIPTIKLSKIFRQAEESRIIVNAHKINNGEMPILQNDEESDFFFIPESDENRIPEIISELCSSKLPAKYSFDPMKDIQVLSPMYKGGTGVNYLNGLLQHKLNPNETSFIKGEKKIKIGDKVMQLKNNYSKEVYNGDIGIVDTIKMKEQKLEVNFNERLVEYDFSETDEITLAYTITVHKSQGAEYPCVIMPVTTAHFIMLQRNLLYTAVTRAAKLMVIIGSQKAITIAVNNKRAQARYTSLFLPK